MSVSRPVLLDDTDVCVSLQPSHGVVVRLRDNLTGMIENLKYDILINKLTNVLVSQNDRMSVINPAAL